MKFTVVLNRTLALRDMLEMTAEDDEIDAYIASVDEKTSMEAVDAAIREVLKADNAEFRSRKREVKIDRDNYEVIIVFVGHPKIALYGFQYHHLR